MILVIPSIELRDGICASKIQGLQSCQKDYDMLMDDPLKLSTLLRKENSKSLHFLDYDSISGKNNYMNLNAMLYVSQYLDIPIQTSSDFIDLKECSMLLDSGIYRVILGEIAYDEASQVTELICKYTPSRIAFRLHSDNKYVLFKHSRTQMQESKYIEFIKNLGGKRIIYSDEKAVLNNTKPDFEHLKYLAETYQINITLYDGINSPQQLWELNELSPYYIDSVILSKALYENKFPCQKIWRNIESEVEFIKK